jgi:hypothetical protein
MSASEFEDTGWSGIYKIGGAAAFGAVLVGLVEILITFLPGGSAPQESVLDWFSLFQNNWFMGLRNLGLLNIFLNTLGVLTYVALYAVHREGAQGPYAFLALIISMLGVGVFYATNRAFAMLDLSKQYAAASTDAQRAMLEAAGSAMLSVGGSHTPGTFLGFFLSEVAGILISYVMLSGAVFSRITGYVGMLGFVMLLLFEIISSFFTGLSEAAVFLAMFGGLLSMAWYILTGRRLFQIG